MHRNSSDIHQKSFRLKHEDDKFFTRLLSKEESSKSNPSFRSVYYGDVPSTVPFTWETIPGTPKHKSSQTSHHIPPPPPLTPPPSYNYTNNLNDSLKKHSRSKLILYNLLRRMNPIPNKKKWNLESSSHSSSTSSLSSSLSWSSPAHSSFSDPITTLNNHVHKRRRRFSSWGSSFDAKSMDVPRGGEVCCFGIGKDINGDQRNLQGIYSFLFVKKVLLSIVGRGSA